MKTIRDYMRDSIEKIKMEDGKHIPMVFDFFITNMALFLIVDADNRLRRGAEPFMKPVKNPNITDYIGVFNGSNLIMSASQQAQLYRFLDWFLDQEAPDNEDLETRWNTIDCIVNKWNEFAQIENERMSGAN